MFPWRLKTTLSMQFLFTTPVTRCPIHWTQLCFTVPIPLHAENWMKLAVSQVRLSEAKDTSGMELITRVQPIPSSIMQGHRSARMKFNMQPNMKVIIYGRIRTIRHSVINWKFTHTHTHYKLTGQLYQFSKYSVGYKVYSQVSIPLRGIKYWYLSTPDLLSIQCVQRGFFSRKKMIGSVKPTFNSTKCQCCRFVDL